MNVRVFCGFAAFVLLNIVAMLSVEAAPPWSRVFSRTRIEAEPDNDYPITEENGPWTIMASTFSGDGAEDQARQLVHELRSRYKLTAYTYRKRFDFSKGTEGRGIDKYGTPLKMKYQHGGDITEIAVLVGDFPSAADANAQRTLRKVKFAQPESLKGEKQAQSNQALADLRAMQAEIHKALLPDTDDRKFRGPMGHAFVTTNPLLPQQFFVPKGLDKLVVDMNKGLKYSLLDCKGKYTVKVATFTGQVVIDQKKIEEIESGKNFKSKLDEAAAKAHKLTELLRKEGVEAYEFHDRYQSLVTIGSFNTTGTPRSDGKTEPNPAMYKIMQQFGAEVKMIPGQPPQVGKAKSRDGITFDITPWPVEVPRRSIAADYERSAMN
jgi:hypothetical protein